MITAMNRRRVLRLLAGGAAFATRPTYAAETRIDALIAAAPPPSP